MTEEARAMYERGMVPTDDGYWRHDPGNARIILVLMDILHAIENIDAMLNNRLRE